MIQYIQKYFLPGAAFTVMVALVAFTACKKNSTQNNITTIDTKKDTVKYDLLWADEFNGNTLNTANWTPQTGYQISGNEEQEYYQAANINVADGNLQITAKKQATPNPNSNYTSGSMTSLSKHDFTYGKVEARIKLPRGQGLWPAFWLLGSNMRANGTTPGVGWPACGEIDIMESINSEVWISGAAHYDNNGHTSVSNKINTTPADYHVYSVVWTSDAVEWFLDGKLYNHLDTKNGVGGTTEFHWNYNVILNLAVGGTWPGQVIDDAKLPATMLVDYVRVYKQVK
jgi:beta-glucanase (GH16 family)